MDQHQIHANIETVMNLVMDQNIPILSIHWGRIQTDRQIEGIVLSTYLSRSEFDIHNTQARLTELLNTYFPDIPTHYEYEVTYGAEG